MYVKQGYPDVLYIVKPSERNEELKYSLRSLKNLNHGKVFMAGYKPAWVDKRVIHIPAESKGEKYENIRASWLAALQDDRLSEQFILMNDDFFVMQPTDRVPVLRRLKSIEHYISLFEKLDAGSYYVATMKDARELLGSFGITDIDSYELHTPMVFEKTKMIELLDKLPDDYPMAHIRTIYGNYYKIGGEKIKDVKVLHDDQGISHHQLFLSTIDDSFKDSAVKDYIAKRFAKVLLFSHANDPDGVLPVVLAQLAFPEVDYLLTNNPQTEITHYLETCDISAYDYVFICDIYPGRPVLKALPYAYWFDHKQHSLNKIKEHGLTMTNATIRTKLNGRPTCATELFYEWLKAEGLLDNRADSLVELIRQTDTWDFK